MEIIRKPSIYPHTFSNQATVWFVENSWGGITPLPAQQKVSGNPSSRFVKLLDLYQQNEKKIREKCEADLSTLEELDFSGLGLTQLPPNILLECKNARSLDISGNDIGFLPVQLQALPLDSLNISNNTKLQPIIPEWLGEMPNLVLTANNIGLDFIPDGFSPDRVISNDLPKEMTFEQTQQLDEYPI